MTSPGLTVVIPAHNEVAYLPRYLPTVLASLSRWEETSGERGEVIVVDNALTDATADMAATFGVRVISESIRSIGRARNSGAAATDSRRLFFTEPTSPCPWKRSPPPRQRWTQEPSAAPSHPSTPPNGSARGCSVRTGTTTEQPTAAPKASPSSSQPRPSKRSADTAKTCS
jgi:hypothetical protein